MLSGVIVEIIIDCAVDIVSVVVDITDGLVTGDLACAVEKGVSGLVDVAAVATVVEGGVC